MKRFRRLRSHPTLRALVKETTLNPTDFVQPFFVREGKNQREEIASMPGIYRLSIDLLLKEIEAYIKVGGLTGLLFGISQSKDLKGTEAYAQNGIVQKALRAIKKEFPDFLTITDVCLCGYTTHGHCGIVEDQQIDNDKTLPLLGKIALAQAEAGSDIIAPSDMMDGRVAVIRDVLDKSGFTNLPILSYAVKYSSSFYGPFREAVDSTPEFGNRKTYQMDFANSREALKEAKQDVEEGADLIMVKPALAYLDIIALLRRELNVPVVAYSVSGEYSMIKAAAQKKWISEKDVVLETLTAIKRAGANLMITYHAKDVLQWL